MSPKIYLKWCPKPLKSESFGTPEATFAPTLNDPANSPKKGGPKGAKMALNDSQNRRKPRKHREKTHLESGPGKVDEEVTTWKLQNMKI